MSCAKYSTKIAALAGRLSGAVSQLSSRQAFLAGLAVGASGTGLGAFLMARRGKGGRFFPSRPSQSLPLPQPIPGLAAKARPIPGLGRPKPIPGLADPPPTKLQPATIQVLGGDGQRFPVQNGYRVVRPDGTETGLAITPHLTPGEAGQRVEQEGAWSVTHTGSGTRVDGPYGSLARAQEVATALSKLSWQAARLPAAQVKQAKAIIRQYREASAATERSASGEKSDP